MILLDFANTMQTIQVNKVFFLKQILLKLKEIFPYRVASSRNYCCMCLEVELSNRPVVSLTKTKQRNGLDIRSCSYKLVQVIGNKANNNLHSFKFQTYISRDKLNPICRLVNIPTPQKMKLKLTTPMYQGTNNCSVYIFPLKTKCCLCPRAR